jgi:hypothetical protein
MRNAISYRLKNGIGKYRTQIVFSFLVFAFSTVLNHGDGFPHAVFGYSLLFWTYTYVEMCKNLRRPHDPETLATLKVSTEDFVDWAVTTMQGELIVSGWGNRSVLIPSTGTVIDREFKIKLSEYVYVVEVLSGNGDAFASLMVGDDEELPQTIACGRSGDPEVIYTCLNTGYGTRHWLVPNFLQGIPR